MTTDAIHDARMVSKSKHVMRKNGSSVVQSSELVSYWRWTPLFFECKTLIPLGEIGRPLFLGIRTILTCLHSDETMEWNQRRLSILMSRLLDCWEGCLCREPMFYTVRPRAVPFSAVWVLKLCFRHFYVDLRASGLDDTYPPTSLTVPL